MNKRILLVDDDPFILSTFRRQLRKQFDLHFAEGGAGAIEVVNENEPFAVVVSDMQMPGMNGLELLCHMRDLYPDTVRIMLTGNADQKTASDAVNQGQIFRFINKPCSSEDLKSALEAGLEQHRLITAEQEILSQTLNGSIELLTDLLSMVNPVAFGRANRVREIVKRICRILKLKNCWQLEIAAALSQIGSVTIPGEVLEKSYSGAVLNTADQRMIDGLPDVAANLVGKIPRLQDVGNIIAFANHERNIRIGYDNPAISDASKILDLVLTYDSFALNAQPIDALIRIKSVERFRDENGLIEVLSKAVTEGFASKSVHVSELTYGMILDEELRTKSGLLLVTKGQTLTDSLISRLKNHLEREGFDEPINIRSSENDSVVTIG